MSRRRERSIALDFTSLIDVLFMLVIFLVLTASFGQGQITVDLPQGEGGRREGNAVMITVRPGGELLWNGRVVAPEDLPALAAEAVAREEVLLVAGDRDAPYGRVAEVLEALRRAGVESASLALQGGGQ